MPRSAGNRWIIGVVAVVAVVAVAVAAAIVLRPAPAPVAAPDPQIVVSRSSCGQDWTAPKPGPQTFQVHNTGAVTTTVDLIDPTTGGIFGEVEGIGTGTTRPLAVTLGDGEYAFRCLPDEADAVVGPTVRISGSDVRPSPAVVPVTRNDLLGPEKDYRQQVITGLDALVRDTDALATTVHGGDRHASEAAWLTAHLSYARLGAAYGAFGDAASAIDGTPGDLAGGTSDPGFTGFHRLEFGLWHDEPMPALATVADRLDADARALQQAFPDAQIDPNDLALRAHEIMEDALQFEVSSRTDFGSGTTLATTLANIEGTRTVLGVLRPLLQPRMPTLSTVDMWLDRATAAVQAARRPDGSWTPVAALDRAQHAEIDGAIGELTEQLAPVATIVAPRRDS
ncbi:EfeM/EfeO family lipoprotein [Pseudonocardia xinjiangensis]|uniref:EfeM/EfeO family lipoprotein n=1 Tax=Pseudonocardia xinjiangensis TaxID=75289 RepID=UPI0028A98B33|nr:EfeM/EfeO family lipoprotein [Pseudonocardia xinjiangensis]